MAITAVRCHVSGADVIRITDLEDNATRIICSEYQESTGGCRLMKNAHNGGPLARFSIVSRKAHWPTVRLNAISGYGLTM